MNRIIVNGEDLDLYPQDSVNLNIKVNDLADISTRNSTFSNTVKIPATDKNKRLFGYLGIIGNQSRKPYEKVRCHYISNDLPLINDGYLQIKSTSSKEFNIVLFDGIIDLSERISGKNISDLSLFSSLNHTRSSSSIVASLDNISGYTYPFANYVFNESMDFGLLGKVTASEMMPMVFIKTVLIKIIEEAGYTYSGNIFNNEEFSNEVFSMNEGIVENVIDFTLCLPKISQVNFIKDILNRYGLILRLKDNNIEFAYLEDILAGNYGFIDWTHKLNEIKSEKYNTNYAQNNLFSFNYSDKANTDGDGTLFVTNETLDLNKTLYKSVFDFNSDVTLYNSNGFVTTYNLPLFEYKEEDEEIVLKPKKFNPCLFKLNRTGNDFEIRETTFSADTYNVISDLELIPTTSGCSWTEYLNDKYPRLQSVLNHYKTVTADLNLSTIDLHNLDLFKIYFFSQTGQYYYLNSVKSNGLKTSAELTQINKLLEDKGFILPPNEANLKVTSLTKFCPSDFNYQFGFTINYEIEGYQPEQLFLIINKLDGEGGNVISTFTTEASLNYLQYTHYLSYYSDLESGWYNVQLFDPQTNIYSDIEEIYIDCFEGEEPEPSTEPSIEIISYFYDLALNGEKRMGYKFNNFTPTSATMLIRGYDYVNGQPEGNTISIPLNNLTQDELHIVENITTPSGLYIFYQVKIVTSIITKTVTTLI
ncbi:hypothetical protein [Corallibacter sp.]|uniref:hypothetical protein n=1 Tax=Corallibacter sp. TaxID=2038084 RepID=UPI003AB26AC1